MACGVAGTRDRGPCVQRLVRRAPVGSPRPQNRLRGGHTIWKFLLDMAVWERTVLRRPGGEPTSLSTEEDWPPVTDSSETAWGQTLTGLADSNARLREAIGRLP